jgi:hypothetical protein
MITRAVWTMIGWTLIGVSNKISLLCVIIVSERKIEDIRIITFFYIGSSSTMCFMAT